MSAYWDSSALINALVSVPVVNRLSAGEHVTRLHAYVEVFHHISGRGLPRKNGPPLRVTPGDAARLIRGLAQDLAATSLDEAQMLQALDEAHSRGVMGRMVHDWLHVRAAKFGGTDTLLTRDEGLKAIALREGMKVEWP